MSTILPITDITTGIPTITDITTGIPALFGVSKFFFCKKAGTPKNLLVQPIPLGVTFSKAQSSKLEHLFYHVSVKTFEL